MARRKKTKEPLPPPLKVGDLVKLVPLNGKTYPMQDVLPPGSMGIVIEAPMPHLIEDGFEVAGEPYHTATVKFFLLTEPEVVWTAWLTKVHTKV